MTEDITILAVDDDSMNLEMVEVMLTELNCRFLKACNGQQALDILETEPDIDVILLDLVMPVMDGYETIQRIKQNSDWRDLPVIVVTARTSEVSRSLALGANDFISKPYNPEELRLRVTNHARSKKLSELAKDVNDIMEREVVKKTIALQKSLKLSRDAEYEISLRLGRAAEFRDQDTGMHTRRISELSKHLAILAGLAEDQCEMLRFAAPLHDVGKIGIPDHILLKAGTLDDTEFEIMKMHTSIGGKILSDAEKYPLIESGSIIALQHHEKWDGTGYPAGLKGEEIHIFARIVAIVDVFDALTSVRPYKESFSLEKSTGIMANRKGTFFEPRLLELFFDHIDEFVAIRNELLDAFTEISPDGTRIATGNQWHSTAFHHDHCIS